MAQRRYVYMSFVVPYDIGFDIMTMTDGKAQDFVMRPVRHGGEHENGALKSGSTGREFVFAFAQTRKQFTIGDAITEAEARGLSRATVYTATNVFVKEKVLKRLSPGVYVLINKERPPSKRGRPKAKSTGIRPAIIAVIKRKQNGTGEGVTSTAIREALTAQGVKANHISTTLSQMVNAKKLKRTAPGAYRVEG